MEVEHTSQTASSPLPLGQSLDLVDTLQRTEGVLVVGSDAGKQHSVDEHDLKGLGAYAANQTRQIVNRVLDAPSDETSNEKYGHGCQA